MEDLLLRHYSRIHALCHRLTGDADADDACQESLIAIARGLSSFDGRSSFTTWVYRVTTNACLDELRRRRRRPVPTDDGDADPPGARPGPEADLATSTADVASARIDVSAALSVLPPEFRAAVVLRDLCDLTYGEIAETLGVPVGTVRSRIARGRAALAPLLAPGRLPDSAPHGNRVPPTERPSPCA